MIFPEIDEVRFEVLYSNKRPKYNHLLHKTKYKESESKLYFLLKQSQILYRAYLESDSKISETD